MQNIKMKDLKNCETPFNWNISEQLVLDFSEESLTIEQEASVINLIYSVMISYIFIVKSNHNKAVKNLYYTDFIWSKFDYAIFCLEGISLNLILEIILSTKLHVLYATDHYNEASKVLSELKKHKTNKKREINSNSLNGCKAIAWTVLHENGANKAILYAKAALRDNPNCSLWHFTLGKNLRRLRRREVWCCNPSVTELQSFVKAYELSNNSLYGIYTAQCYQENLDDILASEYYIKVFETNPNDCKIQLRLALCFLRSQDLQRAKLCLDNAENCCPKAIMLYHYKGIYYKKIHNFALAAEYFEKASKGNNIGAFIQYGQCMLKVDEDFSYLFHLFNLLKKFRTADNTIIQQLLLDIAMEQYHNENYEKAFEHFIKGIKLSPKSKILKFYPPRFNYTPKYNIFEFVNKNLIPKLEQNTEEKSENIVNCIKDFKTLLKKYIQEQQVEATSSIKPLQDCSWTNTFKFYIYKINIVWEFFRYINVILNRFVHLIKNQ